MNISNVDISKISIFDKAKYKYCYDLETSNKSFLEVCNKLKSQGIKNNMFMLTIIDDDLIGVDPHKPDLSTEIKNKIIKECKNNIWYFLREVVRIPVQGGTSIKFNLNLANCAQIFCYNLNIPTWVTSPDFTFRERTMDILNVWALSYNDKDFIKIGPRLDNSYFINLYSLNKPYIKNHALSYIPENKDYNIAELYSGKYNYYSSMNFVDAEYVEGIDKLYDIYIDRYNKYCMDYSGFTVIDVRSPYISFSSSISDNANDNGVFKLLDKFLIWSNNLYDIIDENNIMLRKDLIRKGIHIKFNYKDLGYDDKWLKLNTIGRDKDYIRTHFLLERKDDQI